MDQQPQAVTASQTGTGEPSLEQLARKHGTDKQIGHSYAGRYDFHLTPRRLDAITLLEIGVGGESDLSAGGASLRMWKDYFPSGQIVGIDYYDKRHLSEDRITVLRGDQSDSGFLRQTASRFGPFDIIIDDGSHICEHVITSFRVLFEHLRDGGLYVIEDLQTSYWRTKGGSSAPDRAGTTMSFLKRLVDGLNYAEFDLPHYRPTRLDRSIVSLSFYHNIAFITKGSNEEASNVLPDHPRSRRYCRSFVGWRVRLAVKLRIERADRLGRFLSFMVNAIERRGHPR